MKLSFIPTLTVVMINILNVSQHSLKQTNTEGTKPWDLLEYL